MAAARLSPRELPSQLAAEGFSAIVIDRQGYEDNGAATIAALREGLGGGTVIAETERYIALDLRSLAGSAAGSRPRLLTQHVVASASIGPCGSLPLAMIDQIGAARGPFETAPSVRAASGFKVVGWAVDQANESVAAAVDLVIDQVVLPTFYGSDRPNVVQHLERPAYFASGFLAVVPPDAITAGAHTISVRVVSANRGCYHQSPGINVVVW